jgi:VIT1/CCC1 family predicted Fe2+/Mn2+ transporter
MTEPHIQPNEATCKILRSFQKDEATGHVVYARMAKYEKHDRHAKILQQIADDELDHYHTWRGYTGVDIAPNRLATSWYTVLFFVFGYSFVLRLMENGEQGAVKAYEKLPVSIPEVVEIIKREEKHEEMLISILDEERLKYVGAIVLGLNDALVELTGSIAGFTFALQNTRLVALSAIITGVAATLSMAASNFLAQKADDNPHAFKASLYTGLAYLITVIVLITPYLIFPENAYVEALVTMLAFVILVIMAFNYYTSVAQKQPFWSRFGRMAAISLGVALISFLIGQLAKILLGVDIS